MSQGMNDLLTTLTVSMTADEIQLAALEGIICGEIVSQRIKRGMTQKQFAEFMNVSQGMVSKWESGEYNFSLQSLVRIAAKLDLDVQSPFITEKNCYCSASKVYSFTGSWHTRSSAAPIYHATTQHDTQFELEEM